MLRFCRELRRERDIERITDLPKFTGGAYELALHRGAERPLVRSEYFSGFDEALDQLVFIDPDTGFEPSKCEECHVAYRDVSRVLEQLNDNSIVSVFQYQRRKFSDDLTGIRARLGDCYSTALYWRSLMFVSIAKSPRMIETIAALNQKYATRRERVYVIP